MASEWRSTCGDNYDSNNLLEDWDAISQGGAPPSAVTVASGVSGMTGNCLAITQGGTYPGPGNIGSAVAQKNLPNVGTRYFGVRINTAGTFINNWGFLGFYDTGTLQVGLSIMSDGSIRAFKGGYQLGGTQLCATNPGVVSIGTAIYIGVACTFNTAALGSISIYVNNVLAASASGVVTSTSGNNNCNGLWLVNITNIGGTVYFDDIKVNNNVGSGNAATVPLPQQVKACFASAAGRYSQMTPSGAAQNYQCISSVITNGLATYVQAASVLEDAYVMAYPSVSNIDGVSTCDSAWTSDGGSATLTPGFTNGSLDALGTAINVPASPHILHQCFDTNPLTGVAWTSNDFATLQRLVQRSA